MPLRTRLRLPDQLRFGGFDLFSPSGPPRSNIVRMARAGSYLVVYDLSRDRERDKVASLLGGYGRREQFSVFACRLTRSRLGRLQRELKSLDLESGWVGIYRLQSSFQPLRIGQLPDPGPTDEDRYAWVVS